MKPALCRAFFFALIFTSVTSAETLVGQATKPTKAAAQVSIRDYSAIDAAVEQLPRTSLAKTSAALTVIGGDSWGKARALFDWLCDNIEYDTPSFYHPGPVDSQIEAADPDTVFSRHQAVCAGYASLFHKLGKQMGLEVVTISGRAKGTGYQPFEEISVNHDWNAVKIEGRWHLVDTTWGAGYVNNEAEGFKRWFNPMWFDIPPELAIHWHLPENPQWALLAEVPSYEDYKNETPPPEETYESLALAGVPLEKVTKISIDQLPSSWQIDTLHSIGVPGLIILDLAKRNLTDQSVWDYKALAEAGAKIADVIQVPQERLPTNWQTKTLSDLGYPARNILAMADRGLTNDEVFGRQTLAEAGLTAAVVLKFPDHTWTANEAFDVSRLIGAGFRGETLLGSVGKRLPVVYSLGWNFQIVEAPHIGQLPAGVPVHFKIAAPNFSEGATALNQKLLAQPLHGGVLDILVTPEVGKLSINLKGKYQGKVSYWEILGYDVVSPHDLGMN